VEFNLKRKEILYVAAIWESIESDFNLDKEEEEFSYKV